MDTRGVRGCREILAAVRGCPLQNAFEYRKSLRRKDEQKERDEIRDWRLAITMRMESCEKRLDKGDTHFAQIREDISAIKQMLAAIKVKLESLGK